MTRPFGIVTSWVLLGSLAVSGGCGYSAAETVTLQISGDWNFEEIDASLADMAGDTGQKFRANDDYPFYDPSTTGDTIKVELAPVTDAEAFAEQIAFGEVTSVDGRVIHVVVPGEDSD